jgi:hypothetical protein
MSTLSVYRGHSLGTSGNRSHLPEQQTSVLQTQASTMIPQYGNVYILFPSYLYTCRRLALCRILNTLISAAAAVVVKTKSVLQLDSLPQRRPVAEWGKTDKIRQTDIALAFSRTQPRTSAASALRERSLLLYISPRAHEYRLWRKLTHNWEVFLVFHIVS